MPNPKSLTLVDFLVGICLCIFLLAAFVPAAEDLKNADVKLRCAENLKKIAHAMIVYANEHNGKYPRTTWDFKAPEKLTAYSAWKAKDPFAADGPGPGDLTAPIYLLCRTAGADPAIFICPATQGKALHFGNAPGDIAAKATDISNFPAEENLSYSMFNPYGTQAAIATQWVWDCTISVDEPIFADMNPGTKELLAVSPDSKPEDLRKANTRNHDGTGQNVLYGDYHVLFQPTPFCGQMDERMHHDNIYARSAFAGTKRDQKIDLKGDPIVGPATDQMDTILLPTAGYKPDAAKAK